MRVWTLMLTSLVALAACSGGTDKVAVVTEPPSPSPTATSAPPTLTAPATTTPPTPTTTSASTTTSTVAPTTTVVDLPPILAPEGDGAYVPPDPLPPGNPGEVIWRRPLGEVEGATSELLLYHSTSADGTSAVATAAFVVPTGPEPSGGRPIVSWAHGTTGLADVCAPSRVYGPHHIIALQQFLAAGYAVVATDYQGLGTPGLHPYLVGDSQGRSVLDAARAAHELLGNSSSGTVLIGGHSQGGQSAIWAGQLAPTYMPELDVTGIVAIAPAVDLSANAGALTTIRPLAGYGVAALAGLAAYYPDLELADVLSGEALGDLAVLDERCMGDVLAHYTTVPYRIVANDPSSVPGWAERIAANVPGSEPLAVPLLLLQGEADSLIIESVTSGYSRRACEAGSIIDYRIYDDADHGSILAASEADMLEWIAGRFDGRPTGLTCK